MEMEKENKKTIEIPFGAKDSELNKFEYTIPEGYEAEIKDGKVIVKKKESEDEKIRKELYEFIKVNSPTEDANRFIAWLERQKEQNVPGYKTDDYFCEKCQENAFNAGKEAGLKEQKPAEWSDEDERMLSNCVSALKEGANGHAIVIDYGEHEKWLNFLPERFNLQSKQEWSEEDEHYFQNLIMAVDSTFSDGNTKNWLQNRLKSLRPQPHWKPSEEQMDALMRAITWLVENGNNTVSSTLADLRSNLKKLL